MNSSDQPIQSIDAAVASTASTVTNRAIQSTIISLKEIVTIIAGLTVVNTIYQIATTNSLTFTSFADVQALLFSILMIVNVIRFYHGNVRHLDSTYTGELGKGSVGHPNLSGGKLLALDFFVVLIESIIFALLSFLIRMPAQFFYLFTGLLIVDVLWFLFAYQLPTNRDVLGHQRSWMAINVITLVLCGIAFVFGPALGFTIDKQSDGSYAMIFVLMLVFAANTIADFIINGNFYFPVHSPE